MEPAPKKPKLKKKRLPEEISGKFVYLAAVYIFYEPRRGAIEKIPQQCFHKDHSSRLCQITAGVRVANSQPRLGYSLVRTAYGSLPVDDHTYYYEVRLVSPDGVARYICC